MRVALTFAVLGMTILSGCADRGERAAGPDEFSVLPARSLEMPSDMSALPEPTPSGTNLSDATPKADAIAVLGGRPSVVLVGASNAADQSLLSAVRRYGPAPETTSNSLYQRRATLNAYAEWLRFQEAGISVPSAPPTR